MTSQTHRCNGCNGCNAATELNINSMADRKPRTRDATAATAATGPDATHTLCIALIHRCRLPNRAVNDARFGCSDTLRFGGRCLLLDQCLDRRARFSRALRTSGLSPHCQHWPHCTNCPGAAPEGNWHNVPGFFSCAACAACHAVGGQASHAYRFRFRFRFRFNNA